MHRHLNTPELPTTTDELAVTPRGLNTAPDLVVERIHRAANLNAYASHQAPGLYLVETNSDTYTVDLLNGGTEPTAACTCPDYTYRCRDLGCDCKHILLVKRRVRDGVLAPPSVNPQVWMRDYTDELMDALTALSSTADEPRRVSLENTLLLAGEVAYGIDPRALARWVMIRATQG